MLLISEIWTADGARRTFKAPPFKMYKLETYFMSNSATIGGALMLIDRDLEEAPVNLGIEANYLLFFDLEINGQVVAGSFGPDGHTCKYLTIGSRSTATPISASMSLFGTLVSASRADLIWEFLRRGR